MIDILRQDPAPTRFFGTLRGKTVLIFSAHCDDAAIGCGGTLQRIGTETDGECTRIGVVLSGGSDSVRAAEERDAMSRLGVEPRYLYDFPDTRLPDHWFEVKQAMLGLRDEIGASNIGLILCPRLEDRHQDHRVVAENVWRVFRQHFIIEYEIVKYEADLGHPNFYVNLDGGVAERKVDLLLNAYRSRRCHHWWSAETFFSLMRLRGIESNCTYAEGLYVRKLVV
jgi:LmbE family N-acetylglucosaminyl deacetylase